MVSKTLTIVLIAAVIAMAIQRWINPPQPQVRPHRIEVGKTLARARMRRLGVEGDWRDFVTPGLRVA